MNKEKQPITEKIGEVNFAEFRTEIKVTSKVKKYLENERVSLATLIPNAWQFYEVLLFDSINKNQDGKTEKELGINFLMIYNKITEKAGWNKEKGLETSGFEDNLNLKEKVIFYSGIKLTSVKDTKKEFTANYFVVKK